MKSIARSVACCVAIAAPLVALTTAAKADQNPPVIPVPPGYGHYCSVAGFTRAGLWAFANYASASDAADPCHDLLAQFPRLRVARAGLWSIAGQNNVMVRCTGDLRFYRGTGDAVITTAYNDATGKKGCVFIVSPTELPIFTRPYSLLFPNLLGGIDGGVQHNPSSFNYDMFGAPWDVSQFGQPQDADQPATEVDRYGRQQNHRSYDPATCAKQKAMPPCNVSAGRAFEGAYDWSMAPTYFIVPVAPGIVRGAWARDITAYNCQHTDPLQREVFVEHQIGNGTYAERIVSAYHHMSEIEVSVGQIVGAATRIGPVGTTGCSTGIHLDFSVFRLTNLSGGRGYVFKPDLTSTYGVNGVAGQIDPFGWAAPQQVDPWAWKYLGSPDPNGVPFPPGITDLGAFSINLWKPGSAPPVILPI